LFLLLLLFPQFLLLLSFLLGGQPRLVLGFRFAFLLLRFLLLLCLLRVVAVPIGIQFFQQTLAADLPVLLQRPCVLALDADAGGHVQQHHAVAGLVDFLAAGSRAPHKGFFQVLLFQERPEVLVAGGLLPGSFFFGHFGVVGFVVAVAVAAAVDVVLAICGPPSERRPGPDRNGTAAGPAWNSAARR